MVLNQGDFATVSTPTQPPWNICQCPRETLGHQNWGRGTTAIKWNVAKHQRYSGLKVKKKKKKYTSIQLFFSA